MLSFDRILQVFDDILRQDPLYEVVSTSHGYTLLGWEPNREEWYSVLLLDTPESIFAWSADYLNIIYIGAVGFFFYNILSGVLRGAGRTGAAFWPVAIGMWCVRITTAMLFVYKMKLGLHGVWFAMVADLIARGGFCIFLVRGVNWKQICCRNEHE